MVLSADTALWVVPVSNLAGVARHVLDVARTGIPGWHVRFLVPPGDLPAALRAEGADVLEANIGPQAGTRASVAAVRQAVRTLRPRVVHSHLAYADIAVALAVGRGPRLVSTEHGIARDDTVYHDTGLTTRMMALAHTARVQRFHALIAVSEATAEVVREKWRPRTPVSVIYNGVDPVADQVPSTGLRVLSLARLSPEKRLGSLVEGFAALHREHPDARLTLAGVGEEEQALRAQVARLGLGDAVDLPGFVDPIAAMASHDVLAMLSIWENCSYALLDAAARGLGVVASNVGGNPEILPPHCLVDATEDTAVATALATQGRDVGVRPTLQGWPSVAQMCDEISATYDSLGGRR